MRIILTLDIPDEIAREAGIAVIKRAARSGIITEFLASYRQRNGIRGQSRDADRYLEMMRERVAVTEGIPS